MTTTILPSSNNCYELRTLPPTSGEYPLVTILINNYNYGRYLDEAIDSALSQTYPHTEVVVVDDGSTDQSLPIIASYGDAIIPILKPNGGQASAFNAGFAASNGDFICFLDADDRFLPTKVAEIMRLANRFPQASMFYHPLQFIDTNGSLTSGTNPQFTMSGDISPIVEASGGWWQFAATSSLTFPRLILDTIMPVPECDFKISADAYLAYLAPFLGNIHSSNVCLSSYRLHNANLSRHWKLESQAALYRACVESLNSVLERLEIPRHVSLSNHLPYQRILFQTGQGSSLLTVTRLALGFPAEPRMSHRLRWIAGIWRDFFLRKVTLP